MTHHHDPDGTAVPDEPKPVPFYGHALSWPARASIVLLCLVVAYLLTRVLTEGSRTRHLVDEQVAKTNKNAVKVQDIQTQIDKFGRIFCGQQDALRGLPTDFPPQRTEVGQALVGSILKIQRSGQIVYIQLKCPTPAAGSRPTPSPGG